MRFSNEIVNKEKIIAGVKLILEGIGVDPEDPDFKETPERVAEFYHELLLNKLSADDYKYFSKHGDMVLASGIKVYGLCPHHLLPVEYVVDIAYIPLSNVVGISKLIRAIQEEVRFPKLQEKFTEDVADRLVHLTGSSSVLVVVRGRHFCMVMRGVKTDATIITTATRGEFKNSSLKHDVLSIIKCVGSP